MAALAAFFVLAGVGGAAAQNCRLGLMASFDMMMLPEGRVTVPVSINGSAYNFMVDTAGIYSKVSDEVADNLGLKKMPTNRELYGVNGKEKVFSVDIDSLKLGGIEAKHFHLVAGGFRTAPDAKFDGVLAGDLLTQFDVEFDFAAKKLNLFSQDHCPGKVVYWTRGGYAELPFRMANGPISNGDHIDLTMTLDGHELNTELDTGSWTTWLRHKAAVEVFGLDDKSPGMERVPGSPDASPEFRKQFGELGLAGVAVKNPVITIISDQFDQAFRMAHTEKSRDDPVYGAQMNMEPLTLGMTTLTKLHLYIAYKEHKIYVTPADQR